MTRASVELAGRLQKAKLMELDINHIIGLFCHKVRVQFRVQTRLAESLTAVGVLESCSQGNEKMGRSSQVSPYVDFQVGQLRRHTFWLHFANSNTHVNNHHLVDLMLFSVCEVPCMV